LNPNPSPNTSPGARAWSAIGRPPSPRHCASRCATSR
jgi:hypothetical protein